MVQEHQEITIVEIDDLQPDWSIKGFKASWKESGLVAYAYLMPLQDEPARGYVLEYSYDSEKQPGRRLTDRQIDQGTTLVSRVRARMLDAMHWAGWQVVGKQETGRDIWQHSSRLVQDKPQEQDSVTDQGKSKAITVPISAGRQSTSYTRTITARHVTFTCSQCGQQVTKVQFPGPTPRYCDTCAKEVDREKTRARVARLRDRNKSV